MEMAAADLGEHVSQEPFAVDGDDHVLRSPFRCVEDVSLISSA